MNWGHIHLERLKSRGILAVKTVLRHTEIHWALKPASYSAKTFEGFEQWNKQRNRKKMQKQLRRIRELWTWNHMFLKYGAVCNTCLPTSLRRTQRNPPKTRGDVKRHVHQQTTTILSYSKPGKRAHHTCQGARFTQDSRKTDLWC